jgi:competence protein ComEC
MAAGRQVIVYTGSGASDGIRFFMGSGTAVWNNRGDTATLTDTEGRVIATYVY